MFHGYPQSGLKICRPALGSQTFQPLHRYLQFPGGKISFRHQQGMQLLCILRKMAALLHIRQFLFPGGNHLRLLQLILHRSLDSSGGGIIIIHDRGFLCPLQGK